MIWIFVCIFGFLTRGVFVVVIYSFMGSIVNLCNCCYLDSTRLMCMLRCAHFAWWAFSKRHRANCGMMAIIRKVPILGASQVVSEPRFCWYPRVRSACRITLPTVVVVSSVKTILLKMSWIDLSSSAFYSLPLCFSPLTFASFESSLLPTSSLGSCVGGRSLTFNLIGPHFGSSSSSTWARILCWWCREETSCWWCRGENLLLVVSTRSTRLNEDSIV
jgi:hypothetical protein